MSLYDGFGLFIGGDWRRGSGTAEVLSPVTERPLEGIGDYLDTKLAQVVF